MNQLPTIDKAEVLDIAFQAVRLYAETHPRPMHVTQGQAVEILGITMDKLIRMMSAKKIRLNECGMIPMPDIDLVIASRTKRQQYTISQPIEEPPPKHQEAIKPETERASEKNRHKTKSTNPAWMRIAEVREIAGIGTTAIYSWIKDGKFPSPFKVGSLTYWVRSEIEEWADKRMAQRV